MHTTTLTERRTGPNDSPRKPADHKCIFISAYKELYPYPYQSSPLALQKGITALKVRVVVLEMENLQLRAEKAALAELVDDISVIKRSHDK